ncbi:flagellar biosynthetic protein FliR [Rosenbergiella australiborealis]|uniref:flagellar biosynthetic protein FliR n=1 Tax=Rosenbergiella australiborealis TaxID=1544696 RepID=UPI001F4E10C8|nr:flagellar biosynthetic protein FliR [Rosenbergiella australiborealis]
MDLLSLTTLLDRLPHFFLPFCRIVAFFFSAPLFSEKSVSVRLRVALAMLLSFLLALSHPDTQITLFSVQGGLLLINQCVIGAALGVSMQCIFAAVRLAGEVVALQMGLSFASFFDAASHSSLSVVSRLLAYFSLLLFVNTGGILWMIEHLAESFEHLPYTATDSLTARFFGVVELGKWIFLHALQLSLPLIFTLLAVNIALGLLNRMTPQFSAFVIGFPLTLLIGIYALYLSMPLLLESVQQIMQVIDQRLFTLVSTA